MSQNTHPLISIIVPTYNEEADIARTMDALAAQTYHPIELIVVDGSTDRTPEIVLSYADRIPGLRLLEQGPKPGVSAARNVGLRAATGEIVVILNADVFPNPDFIEKISPYYEQGADYLLVNSEVANIDKLLPRYLQAQHVYNQILTIDTHDWTEGFSCRLAAIRDVGGFPEEFGHNTAGEDAILGERLRAKYNRALDFSITVPHIAPEGLKEYWRQRLGRGRGGGYRLYAFDKRPVRWGAIVRSVLGTWFLAITLISPLIYSWRLLEYTPRGLRDWLPFTGARIIEMFATGAGYWNGSREVVRLGLDKRA